MGLRNTLEPDPDNTGVGSFLQPSGFLPILTSRRKLLCFRQHRNEGSVCKQPPLSPGSLRPSHLSSGVYSPLPRCLRAPCQASSTRRVRSRARPALAPAAEASSQTTAAAPQKPAPVTTTVIVHGEVQDNYLPESVTVGTLTGEQLKDAPLSATVVTRDLLNDQVSRLLSDVVNNDASVGDDYVPVGYYGVYEIRGFPLDPATGLEINGMTIAGEQDVPLENKQSVEILHGLAAVESGVASAGGLIDYVTKRPANIQDIDLATDHRGTAYGAVDLGHLFGSRKQVGARVNLAGERIVTYMNDTNGWRAMGAGAADWKIDSATTLKGDFEYQHKTERDGSGYQLLGGTTLPDINHIYRSTMLGDQSWGLPDTYDTFNTGARIDHTFSPAWLAFAAASLSHSLIQDNVLYVYGCYYEDACNTGSAPYPWFFAPDGTYDIYDYRDPNELRIDAEAEAMVTGHFKTGAITHDVAAGRRALFAQRAAAGLLHRAESRTIPAACAGRRRLHLRRLGKYLPADCSSSCHRAHRIRLSLRCNPPARAACGKTATRQPRSCRTASIFPAAFSSSPAHVTTRYATTTTRPTRPAPTSPIRVPAHQTSPTSPSGCRSLPSPSIPSESLTLYANYGVMLSLGPQAPFWTLNGSQFLDPFFTRQVEIGAKYEPGSAHPS